MRAVEWLKRAGRLLVEAGGAAASGAAAAYAANPRADGEQIGAAAGSAAAVYIVGALRRSFLPSLGGRPAQLPTP